jgi:large subunit ribosomal protein L4
MLSKLQSLPEALESFSDKNLGTLWQVVKSYRANLRQGTVGTKTRAMVASTGKKPYKQKKTGNARRGSFVSPLNVGGGVSHGPQPRDYRQSIPTKMAHAALGIALSERIKSGQVFIGDLAFPTGKTKDAFTLLKEVLPKHGRTVICLDKLEESSYRALRNIKGVHLVSPLQINALTLLNSRAFISTSTGLEQILARVAAQEKK